MYPSLESLYRAGVTDADILFHRLRRDADKRWRSMRNASRFLLTREGLMSAVQLAQREA